MKKAVLVAAVLATASPSRADGACNLPEFSHEVGAETPEQLYRRWKACHPQFEGHHVLAAKDEEAVRATFAKNAELVFAENEKHAKNGESMRLGLNEFAGLTNDEWRVRLNLQRKSLRNAQTNTSFAGIKSTSSGFRSKAGDDFCGWPRENQPAVKNQGNCGSCYAFGAGSALEGAIALWNPAGYEANGQSGVSEAQMLACCAHGRRRGCEGGMIGDMMDCAFHNLRYVETAEKLPYDDQKVPGVCPYGNPDVLHAPMMGPAFGIGKKHPVIGEENYEKVFSADGGCNSHYALSIGIALDASLPSFMLYSKGVYSDDFCSQHMVNHAVGLTGFGTEDGTPYWDVRNSWGDSWGQGGFIKIKKGVNMCALGTNSGHNFISAVFSS